MPKFRILHIADPHLCLEPNRKNRISLWLEGKQDTLEGFEYTRYRNARRRKKSDPPSEGGYEFRQRIFSDFYFSSYRPIVAEQLARFVDFNRQKFDAILCAGDLATTGGLDDLNSAYRFISQDPQWGQFLPQRVYEPLSNLGRTLVLMPGNHDRYKDGTGAAGGVTFDLVFRRFWPAQGRKKVHWHILSRTQGRLAIVAADFSLAGNSDVTDKGGSRLFKIWGQGKCHPEILQELELTTAELREKYSEIVVVWAVHFPPMGLRADDNLALRDCEKLIESTRRCEVDLLLSGHLHRKLDNELNRGRHLSAGTCCAADFEAHHWIHLVEIETANGRIQELSRQDYRYSLEEKMFVESGFQNFTLAS